MAKTDTLTLLDKAGYPVRVTAEQHKILEELALSAFDKIFVCDYEPEVPGFRIYKKDGFTPTQLVAAQWYFLGIVDSQKPAKMEDEISAVLAVAVRGMYGKQPVDLPAGTTGTLVARGDGIFCFTSGNFKAFVSRQEIKI